MTLTNNLSWLPADARKRRWAAVALLLLVTALVIAAVSVPAVLLHRHYDENIAKLVRQVSTQTAFNAMRPRLAEKLESLKSREVKKLFLKGTSPALALAELQETVRVTIDTNGGKVMNSSSVQGSVPKEDGPYRQVSATFTLNSNNTNLRRLLYAIETREPYLFIDGIVIQPGVGSGFRPGAGAAEPDMFIQIDVHAFALRAKSELAPGVTPQAGAGAIAGPNGVQARNADVAARNKTGSV